MMSLSEAWPNGKPKGYDKFIQLAKRKTSKAWSPPSNVEKSQADKDYRSEISNSISYCRNKLGLGKIKLTDQIIKVIDIYLFKAFHS